MQAAASVGFDELARWARAAAAVAAMLVIALGISLHADLRLRRLYVPAVVLMIILVPAIGFMVSQRDIGRVDFEKLVQLPPAALWFLRLSSIGLVGMSLVRLGSQLIGKAPASRGPAALLAAFLAYYGCNYLLNAAFGSHAGPPLQQSAYAALVLVAVFLSPEVDLARVLHTAKAAMMGVMIASLALLAIEPSLVRQLETAELRLPGVDFRLFGLGANPNSIATLAIANLLLTLNQSFRRRWIEGINLAATLAVLLLAQSQTSWVATLIAVPALLLGRAQFRLMRARTLAVLVLGVLVIGVGVLAAVSLSTHGVSLSDFATGDRYRELTTLTGRSAIWDAAIAEWRDSPLFGHGPSMWDATYRARLGMAFAFNAHNQYLQSLSIAGLVGLAALLPYLVVLGLLAGFAPRPLRGLALALYLQMLLRTLTEVPLDLGTPFVADFVPHLLLFTVLANAWRTQPITRSITRPITRPITQPSPQPAIDRRYDEPMTSPQVMR